MRHRSVNEQWQYCLPKHGYDELAGLQLFTPSTPSKCYSPPRIDNQFQLQLSDSQAICEVLRLTVSGNTQQNLLPLSCSKRAVIAYYIKLHKWSALTHYRATFHASVLSSHWPQSVFPLRILRAKRWWHHHLSWILEFRINGQRIQRYWFFATTNVQCVRDQES